METVVAERAFTRRFATGELEGTLRSAGGGCLGLHRVSPLRHYVAADGSRVACVFAAPDADAVRAAARAAEIAPPVRLWAATIHAVEDVAGGAPHLADPRNVLVVVERSFALPVAFAEIQAIEDAGSACMTLNRVRFLRSYLARDRRRMLCLYEAPDAEAVRRANSRAGLPFEAAWPARTLIH